MISNNFSPFPYYRDFIFTVSQTASYPAWLQLNHSLLETTAQKEYPFGIICVAYVLNHFGCLCSCNIIQVLIAKTSAAAENADS